jgi:hypothetical protein
MISLMTLKNGNNAQSYTQAIDCLLTEFAELSSSMPGFEILENLGLFISPKERRREFFWYEVYKHLQGQPGCIGQFGVRWGRELALFDSLRSIYEPYNHSRKILGFDTFKGYTSISDADGKAAQLFDGNLNTLSNYSTRLKKILEFRQELSVNPQIKKFELLEGPVTDTLKPYLAQNPETTFSLIHLDFNLYKPTSFVLNSVTDHVMPGTIVVFDELCCPALPGETRAFREFKDQYGFKPIKMGWEKPIWPMVFRVSR